MNTFIMLSCAVTFGVILGTIFTVRVMSKMCDDQLASRDQMWQQALHLRGDRITSDWPSP